MLRFRFALQILLIALLITQWGGAWYSAAAQAERPESPAPPFREPVSTPSPTGSSGGQTDLINPNTGPEAFSNTFLGTGDSYVHGLVYAFDFLWASTRTSPPRIVKIDPSSLSVVNSASLTGTQNPDGGDDLEAVGSYLWMIRYGNPAQLVRIDPVTMALQVTDLTGYTYGASLEYAFGYLWAGGFNWLARIDVSTNPPSIVTHDYSTLATNGGVIHALTSSSNRLWAGYYQCIAPDCPDYASQLISVIDPAAPAVPVNTINTGAEFFPDDIVYVGTHMFASTENYPITPSNVYRFADDLTNIHAFADNQISFGTFENPLDPLAFWGVYNTTPGRLLRFNHSLSLPLNSITLPTGYNSPSEIAFDPLGNMYVSTWQDPAGIVKYTAPAAVTDLSITKSGADAFLSWTQNGSDIAGYQVWRSTNPYFTPGDAGSTKIGDATSGNHGDTITYLDVNAIGDVSNDYFYRIKAVNSDGLVSQISNRVGEISYLVNNSGGKYSLIAIPFPTTIATALDLANYIGNVNSLLKWNPSTSSYQFFAPPNVGNNFAVSQGNAIYINVRNTAANYVSFVGDVTLLSHTLVPGRYNFISIPLQKVNLINASTTAADITNVISILNWNEATQSYRFFAPPNIGINFSLKVGSPFIVNLGASGPIIWP